MNVASTCVKILLGVVFLSSTMFGQKTWTGLGDGVSWSNPANWSGGTVPTSTDQVILDNSSVAGTYAVTLPTATNPVIARLTISPSSPNTITLTLPSGNVGNPGLTVGDSSLTTPYDIVLNSGAVLRNSSGASAGNGIAFRSGTLDSLFVANGGRYVHNTARGDAGIVSQLARAAGTETGIVEFDVPGVGSYSPSVSGRTFGSLTLTATAAGGTKTYTTSGSSALTIRGNLTIGTGATLSSTQTAALNLSGNFTNSGSFSTTTQPVAMVGSSAQTMHGSGSYALGRLTINNAAGVTLTTTVTLSDSLLLLAGKLTIATNNIVIAAAGGADPGSEASYVVTNGPGTLTQKGVSATDRIFPVGTISSYNPVIINNAGVVDTFSVRVQPTFDVLPNFPNLVVNRQWTINESVPGGSNVTIYLQWNVAEQASGFNPAAPVFIGRYDGTFWRQTAASVLGVGPYLAFASGFTSFSPFGVANANGLPVQLASFTGTLIANNRVRLDWRTISEVNNYGFFVQKRNAGTTTWTEIESSFVPGHGTTNEPRDYTFTDHAGITAPTQYRLKQVDLDATVHFSEPIQVDLPTDVAEGVPMRFALQQNYPNPFNPSTVIPFSIDVSGFTSLTVFDVLGREVAILLNEYREAGRHSVRFDARHLPAGVYMYRLKSGGRSRVKKMILLK